MPFTRRRLNRGPLPARGGVLGVDLAASPRHPSALVLLSPQLRLSFVGFLNEDGEILEFARHRRPQLVAIDAPLALPQGLDCLEETCPCGRGRDPRRLAERELAKLGVSCFWTTKKSIIKEMVYRGMRLRGALAALGLTVMEVYPHASKVMLWGKVPPGKRRRAASAFLRERLAELIPRASGKLEGLDHHQLDALIAAYTGWLHLRRQSRVLGDRASGEIAIPLPPG